MKLNFIAKAYNEGTKENFEELENWLETIFIIHKANECIYVYDEKKEK